MVDIKAEDVLYGRNGQITLSTDVEGLEDDALGVLATASNIEARVEVQNTQIMLPRQFSTKLRRTGWSGTGSLRIYRHNLSFFSIMKDMINLEKAVPVFDVAMELINKDPDRAGTSAYEENIVLQDVKFWSYDWMFNMTDFVELPLEYTFENIYESNS